MSEISACSHAIAHFERLVAEADEVYQEAKKQAVILRNRVDLLSSERDKIINDRAHGNETETNESRLVVIAADLKGLEPLLKKAKEVTTKALEPLTLNKQFLDKARADLKVTQARAEHTALTAKSRELEALLIDVITKTHEAGQRAGQRHFFHNWVPSNELLRLVKDRMLPV